jgi:cytochrome b pre-mRNA-processing protein 3
VLATIAALLLVRFEREGEAGDRASVALTERFIEVMESEHRELGLGDPTLGKTVRKLVGMLARRTKLWRDTNGEWIEATRDSLYTGGVNDAALKHSAAALHDFARRLDATPLAELERGDIA